MEIWELIKLKNLVQEKQGKIYAEKLHEPLKSFHKRKLMFCYHADEEQRLIREVVASRARPNDPLDEFYAMTKAILDAASPSEKGDDVRIYLFKAEAHLIAAAQALHSLCDILAFVVYWTFKLDTYPNSPKENKVNLYSINNTLKNYKMIHPPTQRLIDEVTNSEEYEYLTAFVNSSKHKSLIPSLLSVTFGEKPTYGMRIKDFSWLDSKGNKKDFDRKWSNDFLHKDCQGLRTKLLKIGISLNICLGG